jgi:hypothetical protein
MSEQDRSFEKLFGYAVYNGLVIDRAWEECGVCGKDAAEAWDPVLMHVLHTLAKRWRAHITEAQSLAILVNRYGRMPPEGSLRDAPDAFEGLSDEQQELVVFAIHEPITRWVTMERLADRSSQFRSTLEKIPSLVAARHAYQVLFGMHCHTGAVDAEQARQFFLNFVDEMEKAACNAISQGRTDDDEPTSLDDFNQFKASAGEGLRPLMASAWHYESAAKVGQRYLTVGLSFDDDGHTRAALDESTRRFVAAAVTSNSPDRFKYLWKAVIGEAARALRWAPPVASRSPISQAPPGDPTVRRCVRVLSMVHELHKAGYQRLRVLPFLSPSGGYWRAWITFADNVAADGYTLIDWDYEGRGQTVAKYTSGQEAEYFGWKDATGQDARQLAQLFIDRFPAICGRSVGLDWAYAGWLTDVLGHAERTGTGGDLVYLIHDGDTDPDYMRRWQPPPPLRLHEEE